MPDRFVSRRRGCVAPALSTLLALPATARRALSAAGGLTVFSAGNGTVTGNERWLDGPRRRSGPARGWRHRVGNNNASPYRIDGKPFALYVGGTVHFDGGR